MIRVTVVQPALAKYRVPVFRELARRPGIALTVVYGCTRNLPNQLPEGFKAISGSRWEAFSGRLALSFQAADWQFASRRHADVVVLRWSPRSISAPLALARAQFSGMGTVLWGHGYSKDERKRRYNTRKWIAKLATAVVFYDTRTREHYVHDGFDPSSLFVAPNSLEHGPIEQARNRWLERSHELQEFRQANAIATGPVILHVSRIQAANRLDLLVAATSKLVQKFPNLKTVIIGNGSAEKAKLEAQARELNVSHNVVFHSGIYDEYRLAPWFLSADVFCYPANIGLSLLHALWYGIPVVTTDSWACQNPEIIALERGVNGLTYKHDHLESLVDAIQQIIQNRSLREKMSIESRRIVQKKFTITRMVDGLESAIRFAHQVKGH